jgi:hypothetical protein
MNEKETGRKRAQRAYPDLVECKSCGATDNLQRHHKDRDTMNNDPDNIETLCASCHGSLHAKQRWDAERARIARNRDATGAPVVL